MLGKMLTESYGLCGRNQKSYSRSLAGDLLDFNVTTKLPG